VYDSKFGNNTRIAEALEELLKSENEVHVSHAKKISAKEVVKSGIDVFLFGGPLRAGNISFTMKSWAKNLINALKKEGKTLKKAAAWGSHATNAPDTPPQFSWEASKKKWKALLDEVPAEHKLDEIIGFDIIPTTLQGPLEPGWEEVVKDFAEKVKML
jgi:menaquinone-dependent protoporphyrinogen IX oxidase